MSGGVDSSVAAFLLKQQGYECEGAIMRLHDTPAHEQDISDAQRVCDLLEMQLHVFDFREIFRKTVIDNFYSNISKVQHQTPVSGVIQS